MDKKHWFKLGAVAVALLLLPRRSSRQAQDSVYKNKETSNTDRTSQAVPSPSETAEKTQSDL
jgi:hypothetical protein